ncbi:MAG: hypothetical protein JW982_13170, partial [Spirochaetes bacterium]|nr:hypothetical protein [Spirochaetota bacterium]
MKINIRAFALSFTICVSVPFIAIFIWCSANNFGSLVVQIFESLHPSGGYSIIRNMNSGFTSKIPGIAINSAYILIDSFISAFVFASFYNFFIKIMNSAKKN